VCRQWNGFPGEGFGKERKTWKKTKQKLLLKQNFYSGTLALQPAIGYNGKVRIMSTSAEESRVVELFGATAVKSKNTE